MDSPPSFLAYKMYAPLDLILILLRNTQIYNSVKILLTNYHTRRYQYIFAQDGLTSEYKERPDKPGPSRRHFGRAVDRSIIKSTLWSLTWPDFVDHVVHTTGISGVVVNLSYRVMYHLVMHSFAKLQSPALSVLFFVRMIR